MNEDNEQANQKKVLRKIRRPFVPRVLDENEPLECISPDSFVDDKMKGLDSTDCLLETNSKIYIEDQYLNPHFDIGKIVIESGKCKIVSLHIQQNAFNIILHSKNYSNNVKKYGDVDLASWAHLTQEYYAHYPHVMDKYFELLHCDSPEAYANLRKAKAKAILTCKEIENNYAHRKLTFFSDKTSTKLLSSSFSEDFLAELGYTVDSFVLWVKLNGFPVLFESGHQINYGDETDFADYIHSQGEFILEGPDTVISCYHKDETKREYIIQGKWISEPTSDGIFSSAYAVLKGKCDSNNISKQPFEESKVDNEGYLEISNGSKVNTQDNMASESRESYEEPNEKMELDESV